ncbi:MAG: flagellar filament capping protein FliD [Hydrogenibacillus schlegelii]|uniref:Flagellar hook-associated protein 2 n=1 Tax=Hydrogenibacillus schlegelii TaxID=1484 RepID=A0A947CUW9_HYDSH|nr:flagellar filament capping protein FliD [Hydrogenibacillus schlegelii]
MVFGPIGAGGSAGPGDIGDVRHFSGLVSGLDTEGIIKKLMAVQRKPLDQLLRDKQWLAWQREAYREVNRSLLAFRDALSALRLTGTYRQQKALLSRDDLAFVTATGAAVPGVHSLRVNRLAKPATVVGNAVAGRAAGTAPTDPLGKQFGIADTATLEFTLTLTDPSGNPLGKATVTVTDAGTKTIADIVQAINAAAFTDPNTNQPVDYGVRASYDPTLDRLFVQTRQMGDLVLTLEDVTTATGASGDVGVVANLFGAPVDSATGKATLTGTPGQTAEVVLDGATLTFADNRFTAFGLDFVLKGADAGAETTITVVRDTEAIVDRVLDFVKRYNDLLDDLNRRLTEPRYRDYPPLLDDEKAQMSEKQIEEWEKRAKSGLLARDPLLERLVTEMRRAVTTPVGIGDQTVSLADIGITTGSWWDRGRLVVDEGKLRAAVAEDPERVAALLSQKLASGAPDAENRDPFHPQKGLAVRLYDVVGAAINRFVDRAGRDGVAVGDQSVLGRALTRLDGRIDEMTRRLKAIEDRYWREFTAMEQAIQRANVQSLWLMQAFGGGA